MNYYSYHNFFQDIFMVQRRRYNMIVGYEEKRTSLKNKYSLIKKWTDIAMKTRYSTPIT